MSETNLILFELIQEWYSRQNGFFYLLGFNILKDNIWIDDKENVGLVVKQSA